MGVPARHKGGTDKRSNQRLLVILIIVVILVGVAAFSIWHSLSPSKQGLEVTPELKGILNEWENTPRGKSAKENMRARLQGRGQVRPSSPAEPQPATR